MKNWFHPKKDSKKDYELPDINFKFMPEFEVHVRRCSECNSILTGLDIVIVRDDDRLPRFEPKAHEMDETELYEAIYCGHCGHQNIIGKYYRHASEEINLTARITRQITRKESEKHELTPNMMRESMGLEPIRSEGL